MGNNNELNIDTQEPSNYKCDFFDIYTGFDNDYNSDQRIEYFINNSTLETTSPSENKPITKIFKITKKKVKRKRMRDNQKDKRIHSKYDYDNIIRKIQVHFQNFLVSFINEILAHFGFHQKFLNIDYKIKKNVKKEIVEKMKSLEIGQILRQNISNKYKKQCKVDKEKNNKLYLEVTQNDDIRKILSEKYINVFRNIYYKNKRDLNDYGLNITLSNNAKTYQDFLEAHKEDTYNIAKINNIVEKCYLPKRIFIHN